MMNEELLGIEAFVLTMRNSLFEYLCKQRIGKFQSVYAQIVVDVLRNIEVHHSSVFRFHIIIYNSVAVADYHFHKHTLHFRRLFQRCCLADSRMRSLYSLLLLCGASLF